MSLIASEEQKNAALVAAAQASKVMVTPPSQVTFAQPAVPSLPPQQQLPNQTATTASTVAEVFPATTMKLQSILKPPKR